MTETTTTIPKSSPKDVFIHLLSVITLYASVISFIGLLWQYINVWFPDPLNFYYSGILNSIRWSASVLVVMFPVYVLTMWLIHKEYKTVPAQKEIRVRKWLVYLTLFISALTVIIDIITLVYNFFGGELSIRFFLKVLVVLITAGAVFGYYYWDLRKNSTGKSIKALAWGVSVLVAASVVGGFVLIGGPAHQRQLNFDERRVWDLQSIQSEVHNYWQQKGVLPTQLSDLTSSISGYRAPVDPETGKPYEYVAENNLSFRLCADFKLPSLSNKVAVPQMYPYQENWDHDAGHVCFVRTIDPERDQKPQPLPR